MVLDERADEATRLRHELEEAQAKCANLEQALVTSRTIGTAVGLLMERYGVRRERALAALKKISMDENVKLRDIAHKVVDQHERRVKPSRDA